MSNPEEIIDILTYLGRLQPDVDSKVRDEHLGSILVYLQQWKNGALKETILRLALRMGMSPRTIRESYIFPLATESIIVFVRSEKNILWKWNGTPKGNNGFSLKKYAKEQKEKQQTKEEVKQ